MRLLFLQVQMGKTELPPGQAVHLASWSADMYAVRSNLSPTNQIAAWAKCPDAANFQILITLGRGVILLSDKVTECTLEEIKN